MPATLNRAFEERFKTPLLDGYGITETSTMVTMNWLRGARPMGSCGLPVPGLAVRIVDPFVAGGRSLRRRGRTDRPRPEPDARLSQQAGGDRGGAAQGLVPHRRSREVGRQTGYLTITGRIKELIIRGGQNIAPAEIEEVVVRHPQVIDCAVVGVRHATLGEVPCLFVVAERDELDVNSLMDHCRTASVVLQDSRGHPLR